MRFRHVAVEGPIGAGKSSLARALAKHWDARLLLEQPSKNPYLAEFYESMAARGGVRGNPLALRTQLSFLFERIDQLRELNQGAMFEHGVVSDFMFAKDAIFAMLTLEDEDLALYRQIYRRHSSQAAEPDLIVWLQAEPDTLLARVRHRGLPMEQRIDENYLRALADAYHRHFAARGPTPVLAVNTEAFHPSEEPRDLERLLDCIERFQGPFEFFDPPDSPSPPVVMRLGGD